MSSRRTFLKTVTALAAIPFTASKAQVPSNILEDYIEYWMPDVHYTKIGNTVHAQYFVGGHYPPIITKEQFYQQGDSDER